MVRSISRHGSHFLLFFFLTLVALGNVGCYATPAGKRWVADVSVEGAKNVDEDDILDRIATRETSRFLGLFPGFAYERELFDQYALRRDLERVERYLRARGYYDARVTAARVIEKDDKVIVKLEIDEGPPVIVNAVSIIENEALDDDTRTTVRKRIASVLGREDPLDEDKLEEAEGAALKALTSTGHAAAKVTRKAEVDVATHRAHLYFTITPGPIGKFGPVRFEGLGELPESSIRHVFGIEEGKRYSSEELDEGRQALLDLGVFASIDVEQDLANFESTRIVPITVKAQEAKIRAFLAGVGLEFDSLKTDVHVQGGWQNGNFLGGLRKLDIRYKPGLVLYPTRINNLVAPTDPLYEHRINGTLRQPGFLEKRTTGFLRSEYNVFPVLLPIPEGGTPSKDVLGYHELRNGIGVERKFWGKLFVSPEYDIQTNFPFDYLGHVVGVDTLIISYVTISANLDFRDDPIKPRRGVFFANELQLAGGPLQGDADDIRVQPEIRGFIPLPKRLTIALRGSVGFLFPSNYSQYSQLNFKQPGESRAEPSGRDYQLLFFRGFYGGGPTSNRGYPLRGIGPHDSIPFLSPAGQSASAGGCNPSDPACLLPTGGLSLWELNAELRWVVSGPFSTALFCDAGDVSPLSLDIRPDRPHLSCGPGARYDTPVGPVRLDVGYRIPGMQVSKTLQGDVEPELLFGVPIAIAFGIGEAF
jgi:outer membrane protein insertion porin family/translocation and assembly module TamA